MTDTSTKITEYTEPDWTWLCTAPVRYATPDQPGSACHGHVLRFSGTSHGVCQRQSHRQSVATAVQSEGYTISETGLHLASTVWPYVLDENIVPDPERTEMRLDQNELQRRLYEYLTSGGSDRLQAKDELELAFADGQTVAETERIVKAYLDDQWDRGVFCHGGITRFKEAIFPMTEPITEVRAFFPDQRTTLTAKDIKNHTGIDAGEQFVPVPALLDAVKEFQAKYDLCNPGVTEFLDEFGLSLIRRFRTELCIGGSGGPVLATFEWDGTDAEEVESLSLGSLDQVITEAIDTEAEGCLNNVKVTGVDIYFGSTETIEE